MQRTVKSTRFTYAETEILNGELVAKVAEIKVTETDEKRAYKKAAKTLGKNFTPLKSEIVEDLWVLDDDIFFKYATIKTPEETPEETPEK